MSIGLNPPTPAAGYARWGMLAAVLATGVLANWAIAAGLLFVVLSQLSRPFDFLVAFLLVAAGASFVSYLAGRLTLELTFLSVAILFALVCYALRTRGMPFPLPRTSLTLPLLLYSILSCANAARGMVAGYPPKHVLIELLPVLAIGCAFLVSSLFDARRDLRLVVLGVLAIGLGGTAFGFYAYAITRTRVGDVYFTLVPGLVGLFAINLALRARSPLAGLGWAVLSLPMFLHQFLSYSRGYWMGAIAGLLVSFWLFGGLGKGSGTRWLRMAQVMGVVVFLGVLGAFAMAVLYGQVDFLKLAGDRFGSITGTEFGKHTASNVSRLVEYAVVIDQILKSPWLGYGLGYNVLVREPIGFELIEQWWVHQNYLLVWLKQGVLGLVVFVWMVWEAIALGIRGARQHSDPWASAWMATHVGATVFLAVTSLSNYPFDQVHGTFLLALFWGATMAMTRKGQVLFRWDSPGEPGPPVPGDRRVAATVSSQRLDSG